MSITTRKVDGSSQMQNQTSLSVRGEAVRDCWALPGLISQLLLLSATLIARSIHSDGFTQDYQESLISL